MLWTVVVTCLLSLVLGQDLVQNHDMESTHHWHCWGFQCHVTTTHHSGSYAIQTSGRTQYYQGPGQSVSLVPGQSYKVSAYARLVNDHVGQLGQRLQIEFSFTFPDGTMQYVNAANEPMVRTSDGWIHLQGDVQAPNKQIKETRIYFQGPKSGVDFIVDEVSLKPMATDPNWRNESDTNINKFRKSNIVITVQTDGLVDLSQVEVQIRQTKKSFPFGTAISCNEYYSGDSRYQDFINQHFNWAVTENCLKWKQMERHQGHINYDIPLRAIQKLRQHGIKVRGHNIVWSSERYIQNWVKALSGTELRQAVHDRIEGVVSRTKDLVEHWDVNNENLHGFYFQEKLQDMDYNLDIFRQAHQAAPNVKMFLNEFDVVAGGSTTRAYRTQAIKFKQANVGLYGVGVQCHFNHQTPDPALIKEHLDMIAQAGLPIWVTELSFQESDEHIRADHYETALRTLYGHPAVEGIMFWGFWSERHFAGESAALVSGSEFRINAAGRRILDLFENQWMTHETHTLSQSGKQFTVHAFHGNYEVRLVYRGQELTTQKHTFTLSESPHTVNLHVVHQ